jgi:thymidylate synthase (FAD)
MTAKLISYTQPTEQFAEEWRNNPDLQDLVVYCARVSNPSNQTNQKTAEKLVRFLAKHGHWSPFELVNAVIEIDTTRDIAHQIVRHRSFAFQEFSQRYADPTKELNFVLREARLQDTKNRQNSIDLDGTDESRSFEEQWVQKQKRVTDAAVDSYKWAIENGIAKEQARAVLPEGLTTSRLYMNGTLRSWIHYIQLRSGNGTQKEHAEIARQCAVEIARIFPMIDEYVTAEEA